MHDFQAVISWTPAEGAEEQQIVIYFDGSQTPSASAVLLGTDDEYTLNVVKSKPYVVKIYTKTIMGEQSDPLTISFTTPAAPLNPPTDGGVIFQPLP